MLSARRFGKPSHSIVLLFSLTIISTWMSYEESSMCLIKNSVSLCIKAVGLNILKSILLASLNDFLNCSIMATLRLIGVTLRFGGGIANVFIDSFPAVLAKKLGSSLPLSLMGGKKGFFTCIARPPAFKLLFMRFWFTLHLSWYSLSLTWLLLSYEFCGRICRY